MKYYERLSPIERKKLVLGAVAFSTAMEGMTVARDTCLDELRALEREQARTVLKQQDDQAMK